MPKLRKLLGGTKTNIYCEGTVYRRCVLAALRTVKLDLTRVGNQAKSMKYSEKKVVFLTNLEQMFIRTAADLDI